MATRQDIVDEAKTWLGVRYKHAGRDRYGIDCVGLPIKVAHGLGLTTYDTTNYSKRPNASELRRELRGHLEQVHVRDARHGDVLVIPAPHSPVHMGILEVDERGDEWLIHAWASARQVVRESLPNKNHVRMAFRYPGLED